MLGHTYRPTEIAVRKLNQVSNPDSKHLQNQLIVFLDRTNHTNYSKDFQNEAESNSVLGNRIHANGGMTLL
jgi:hypothetical protein